MSTRSEQVEACRACWDDVTRDSKQWSRVLRTVQEAAATLTRDGELRERLKKLVEKFRNHHSETPCCGNSEWRGRLCTLHQGIEMVADEVSALLKETNNEQA